MLGLDMLDVAIGVVFVYLMLSLVASAAAEMAEAWLKNRPKKLREGLQELLRSEDLVKKVYEHPVVNALYRGPYSPSSTGNLPSYVPARNFAVSLIDLLPADDGSDDGLVRLRKRIDAFVDVDERIAAQMYKDPVGTVAQLDAAEKKATKAALAFDRNALETAVADAQTALDTANAAAVAAGVAPDADAAVVAARSALDRAQKALAEGNAAIAAGEEAARQLALAKQFDDTITTSSLDDAITKRDEAKKALRAANDANRAALQKTVAAAEDEVRAWRRLEIIAGKVYVQTALSSLAEHADGDMKQAIANIEEWYNSSMDRVSGWFKRRAHVMLFCIGLVLAVGLNVDSIHVVRRLAVDRSMREALVSSAKEAAKTPPHQTAAENNREFAASQQRFNEAFARFDNLGLPIGWNDVYIPNGREAATIGFMIVGWLMTGLAVSLGAPFWFDALNRIIVVRSTVKPDEKSGVEGSKEPQAAADKQQPARK